MQTVSDATQETKPVQENHWPGRTKLKVQAFVVKGHTRYEAAINFIIQALKNCGGKCTEKDSLGQDLSIIIGEIPPTSSQAFMFHVFPRGQAPDEYEDVIHNVALS